jgi:hypothetical protein
MRHGADATPITCHDAAEAAWEHYRDRASNA